VEPGSLDGLTDALRTVLRARELRRRLGSAGRRTVEAGYSFAARMEKFRGLYDELLGFGGRGA
jgi:glycosyltransferase involved in cell wall biosynthesis